MGHPLPPGLPQVPPQGAVATAPRRAAGREEGGRFQREVASVGRTSGGVSFGRGGDPEDWRPASAGLSVATGDRLYTSRGGSLELRTDGFEIHLAPATGLEVTDLTGHAKRFYVWGGSASFRVRRIRSGETLTIDTPSTTVKLDRAGDYRIDIETERERPAAARDGSAWEPGHTAPRRAPRPVC